MPTNKKDQWIMTVERSVLFRDHYFQGFCPSDAVDYESMILRYFQYSRRGEVEDNPNLKQPIGYCLIVNPNLGRVFVYQRSPKDAHYTEKRLQGKWSWGVGGHIDKQDIVNGNPIRESVLRELNEEVNLTEFSNPEVLGYINADVTEVDRVHFGILYLVRTTAAIVTPKDSEIARGRLRLLEELHSICESPDCTVEEWSRIALAPAMDYFSQLSASVRS